MTPTCPRCHAELHPLSDLVKLARQTSDRAAHGLEALENRRLAVPGAVPVALQEAKLDCRILAARLACHAGACAPSLTANGPYTPGSMHPSGGLVRTEKERNHS